jgi:ABC-2 type transport system permease protein
VNLHRLRALVAKELLDLRRNRAALLPVAISTLAFLALPLFIAIGVPLASGQPLGDDADLARVSLAVGVHPELTVDGRVQLFLFEQFLLVFLLMPITGAMALAAHAVVGEKVARTLEPLLATPITTAEILAAKVLGAMLPTFGITLAGLALYLALVAGAADAGVLAAILNLRTFAIAVLVGPAAALVSLQGAILVSSRVNDPRTAQQVGVLIILPVAALIVAQFMGAFWLTAADLALIAAALVALWVALLLVSIALFDREAILTRWR